MKDKYTHTQKTKFQNQRKKKEDSNHFINKSIIITFNSPQSFIANDVRIIII